MDETPRLLIMQASKCTLKCVICLQATMVPLLRDLRQGVLILLQGSRALATRPALPKRRIVQVGAQQLNVSILDIAVLV